MTAADDRTEDAAPASKSQRKREHLALQALAAELAALPATRLRRLELDAELEQEIRAAGAMKASGARNRQLRHVAQQLAEHDPAALAARLAALSAPDRAQVAREQRAAALRERVLEEGCGALGLPLGAADSARLAALRTCARSASDATRARHAQREIYRLILALLSRE